MDRLAEDRSAISDGVHDLLLNGSVYVDGGINLNQLPPNGNGPVDLTGSAQGGVP